MYPELFSFTISDNTYTIYAYGFFVILAIILGVVVFYWQAKKRGLETHHILDNTLWILLGGIIGARIAYVLVNFGFYKDHLREALYFWQGGLTFYGAFIGGLVVAL